MAIYLFCSKCKTTCSINSKKCRKCGSPFPKDGRTYRVKVESKGKTITRTAPNLTLAREAEATLKSDLFRDEFDVTRHKPKAVMTLGELWQKYLPWAKEHKKDWHNDECYYRKHLEARFAKKDLDAITGFDLEKMKGELKKETSMRGRPYAAQTIKHVLVIVRRLYNLARKWGLYDGKNPIETVQMPKVDNKKTEFMTDDEVHRLLEVLETWPCRDTVAFVRFAMLTGFRRGELFKLKWEHVDMDHGMVTLVNPKGGKTQTLPISEQALAVLKDIPRTSEFLFPGRGGKQRTDFKGPWDRIRKAAELPEDFRLHGLRHHFASTLVSNGVDLAVVRELLTHKDMTTTQRYAHLQPDALKKAALQSGTLLAPAAPAKVISIERN